MFLQATKGLEITVTDKEERIQLSAFSYKYFLLCRHDPRLREDVVIFRKQFLHSREVSSQKVFATDFTHPWKVVDLLQMTNKTCIWSLR